MNKKSHPSKAVSRLQDLTREWVSLWCTPVRWDRFEALHSDDFEDCSPAGRAPTKSGFADGLRALTAAFPDLQTTVEDLVVDSCHSKVAVRWSAVGTNVLPFLDIGPTNRRTRITGIELIEFADGRVIRRWGEWDISDHRAV